MKTQRSSSTSSDDETSLHNEAMRIVCTVDQAFEVCQKLALQERQQTALPLSTRTSNNTTATQQVCFEPKLNNKSVDRETRAPNLDGLEKVERYLQSVQIQSLTNNENLSNKQSSLSPFHSLPLGSATSEFTLKHQMQFMQEQLQQMQSEFDLAFNRVKLIQKQLNIETNARIDAQNKNTQLLQRNRELLRHIQQLLLYNNELEMKLSTNVEQIKTLSPRPADLQLPSLFSTLTVSASLAGTSNQTAPSSDSPDSGKGNEISSESMSDPHSTSWNFNSNNNNNNNNNNSTKTFHLTTQSISAHENDMTSTLLTNHRRHGAYSSTSPSLTSSYSSCASLINTHKQKKQMHYYTCSPKEPIYFNSLSTSTRAAEHYLYDRMTVPISSSSASFINSGFAPSPLRTSTIE